MIIAVDFDGTLCEHRFPAIGEPKLDIINILIKMKTSGVKLILWTCREGAYIESAVAWAEQYGLAFDSINKNIDGSMAMGKTKVVADFYLDDRAMTLLDFIEAFSALIKKEK